MVLPFASMIRTPNLRMIEDGHLFIVSGRRKTAALIE